jgi:hypothetical protein
MFASDISDDRQRATDILREIQTPDSSERIALLAERTLALYDSDDARNAQILEKLRALFPQDLKLQVSQESTLAALGRRADRIEALEKMFAEPGCDLSLVQSLASLLSEDSHQLPRARRMLERRIRRNYSVFGRFRYLFEHLGEFFRQYFFAMDRDELPFNRAERSWVYRAAKIVDTTIAFGSTRHLDVKGDAYFLNSPFPTLESEAEAPAAIIF